jgi:hypothetical protein
MVLQTLAEMDLHSAPSAAPAASPAPSASAATAATVNARSKTAAVPVANAEAYLQSSHPHLAASVELYQRLGVAAALAVVQ